MPIARQHRKASRAGRRHAGFVLLYTLWVVAAASVLLAVLAKSASQPARLSDRQISAALQVPEMLNLLDYVVNHTISQDREIDARFVEYRRETQGRASDAREERLRELRAILDQIGMTLDIPEDSDTEIRVIEDDRQNQDALSDTVEVKQGVLFRPSSEPQEIRLADRRYVIWVKPANALPNLNRLPREAMRRYLIHLGIDEDASRRLAAVIEDWIDSDDFLTDDGAESGQYPYLAGPRNGPVESWDELNYLDGVSSALVDFLRQHFTLQGTSSLISPRYLAVDTLAALADLAPWQIEAAIENRDLPAEDKVELATLIGDEEADRFERLIGWETDNDVLRIELDADQFRLTAVFDRQEQQLLDWYFHY